MKIALIGYGKMGKAVEAQAKMRGHEIVFTLDRLQPSSVQELRASGADVAIEFTHPHAVLENIHSLISPEIPIVCGTTGWQTDVISVEKWVLDREAGFIYASNFSIGVNILFKLNRELAKWMNPHPQYDCAIEEQHHRHKADAPSGTALTLAQDILSILDRKTTIAGDSLHLRAPLPEELSVGFIRSGEIPGKHTIIYTSENDTLSLQHTAHNRNGFALGAVIAAEWIHGKKGFYHFSDIF